MKKIITKIQRSFDVCSFSLIKFFQRIKTGLRRKESKYYRLKKNMH